jgi:hypothetical protein
VDGSVLASLPGLNWRSLQPQNWLKETAQESGISIKLRRFSGGGPNRIMTEDSDEFIPTRSSLLSRLKDWDDNECCASSSTPT